MLLCLHSQQRLHTQEKRPHAPKERLRVICASVHGRVEGLNGRWDPTSWSALHGALRSLARASGFLRIHLPNYFMMFGKDETHRQSPFQLFLILFHPFAHQTPEANDSGGAWTRVK